MFSVPLATRYIYKYDKCDVTGHGEKALWKMTKLVRGEVGTTFERTRISRTVVGVWEVFWPRGYREDFPDPTKRDTWFAISGEMEQETGGIGRFCPSLNYCCCCKYRVYN